MRIKKRMALFGVFLLFGVAFVVASLTTVFAGAEASKILVSIDSYSGEWKAAPSNPALTRPQNAIDGDVNTEWYCQWGKADDCYGDAPSITLDLSGEQTVSRVEVCMPSDYVPQDVLIELGNGNGGWAEAGRYRGMSAGERIVCSVPNQRARKLRVTVMEKCIPDNNGFTLAKIAEITAYSTNEAPINGLGYYQDVTSGAVLCSESAINAAALSDGVYTVSGKDGGEVVEILYTDYVSEAAESEALVGYRFSSAKEIGKLTLWGASEAGEIYGFPENFAVVYSPDGTDWYIVPNQVYYDFQPTGGENAFVFDYKISARAVGIKVLKKSALKNGKYAVSLNEMRVFSSPLTGSAYVSAPDETADSSAITSSAIPNGIYNQGDRVEITLSDYFTSSFGALSYTLEGIGTVGNGVYVADLAEIEAGRYTVALTASLNDFCKKRSVFTLAVQSEDRVFVLAISETVEKSAAAGAPFTLDLSALFRYGGNDRLVFTASQGSVSGSTLTLNFDLSGNYETIITCYPESDESLGSTVTLTVKVALGSITENTLFVAESEYTSPAASFALAGGLAGGLTVAAVIVFAVLFRRKTK